MATPTPNAFLEDPLLMAFDALPANKLLQQEQVSLLLECTTRWLEDRRSQGAPPPYVQLGERMIRYAVGPLREWLRQTIDTAPTSPTQHRAQREANVLGFDEPILRGGRRKKLPARSFASFMASASNHDEWLFALRAPHGRPVDFLADLELESSEDDGYEWLTLEQYGQRLTTALGREQAAHSATDLSSTLEGRLLQPADRERM